MSDAPKPPPVAAPERVLGWMRCHWDCPECGEDVSLEGDRSGEDVKCDACGNVVHIYEVR